MRGFEERQCLKCGGRLKAVDGTDRTVKDKVWFWLRCGRCGHTEMDWVPRNDCKTA